MARGIALIAVAVLLGVILLRATDSPEPFASVETQDGSNAGDTTAATDLDVPDTTDTTTPRAHNPAEVTVLVANGAGITGLASRVADSLKAQNYILAESGNTRAPADASAVYYSPGYEADAAAIAKLLSPTPKVEALPDPLPVADLKGANVLVVAAADLAQATG